MKIDFENYLQNTKIKQTFVEYDLQKVTVLFEDTMKNYLERCDKKAIFVFTIFYSYGYNKIELTNIYGNKEIFELIK